jgi:hypothetical protein
MKFSDEEIKTHLLSTKEKERLKKSGKISVPDGFGSKNPKRGNLMWRQLKYQENLQIINKIRTFDEF